MAAGAGFAAAGLGAGAGRMQPSQRPPRPSRARHAGRPAPHARGAPLPGPRDEPSRRGALPTRRAPRQTVVGTQARPWCSPFFLKKAADTMSAAYQIQGWRRRESNPRPLPCDGSALPTELRPQDKSIFYLRLANCQRPITSLFGARLFWQLFEQAILSMIF